MEIKITVKQFGRKHPILTAHPLSIACSDNNIQLEQLLLLIVTQQLTAYNNKTITTDMDDVSHSAQHDYIQLLMNTGKAGFGNIYNENSTDLDAAQQNVIEAFKDGIFAVFQGDEQLDMLSQNIDLTLNTPFTFIRLTFLAGSYW